MEYKNSKFFFSLNTIFSIDLIHLIDAFEGAKRYIKTEQIAVERCKSR